MMQDDKVFVTNDTLQKSTCISQQERVLEYQDRGISSMSIEAKMVQRKLLQQEQRAAALASFSSQELHDEIIRRRQEIVDKLLDRRE